MSASALLFALTAPVAATGLAVSDDRTAADGAFADLLATETTEAVAVAVAAPVAPPIARTPSLSIVVDGPIDGDAESLEAAAGLDSVGAATLLSIAIPTVAALPSTASVPLQARAASDDRPAAEVAPAPAIEAPTPSAPDHGSARPALTEAATRLPVADEAAVLTEAVAVIGPTVTVRAVRVAQATDTVASEQPDPASPAANVTAPKVIAAAPSELSKAPGGHPAAKTADAPPVVNGPAATVQPVVADALPASVATPREPPRAAQSGIDLVKAALASDGQPSTPARVTGPRPPIVAEVTAEVAAAPNEAAEAPVDKGPIIETRAVRPPVVTAAATSAIPAATPSVAAKMTSFTVASPIETAPPSSDGLSGAAAAIVTGPGPEAAPVSRTTAARPSETRAPGAITPVPTQAASIIVAPAKTGQATNASVERPASDRSQGDGTNSSSIASPPTPQPAPATVPAATGFEPSPVIASATATAPAPAPAPAEPAAPLANGATASIPGTAVPAPPVAEAGLSSLSRATIETTAQLAAQITRRLEGRSTRFEMALTPDGLGRVDVSLDIDADGQLAARLAFDNPLAATDLRGRADELRRQLEDAGFTLARDALEFSGRDGSSGGGQAFDRRQGRAAAYATRNAAAEAEALATPAPWINPHQTPRGVDLKV